MLVGVLAVVGVSPAPAQTPPPEAGCTVIDPTGDTFDLANNSPRPDDRADITQLCVSYGYSLRVAVLVAGATSPATDPGWGPNGDSLVELRFDTGGDDQPELALQADGEDEIVVRNPADGSARCTAFLFPLPNGYATEISRNCLNSDTVRVRALMVYDPAPNPNPGPRIADRAPDTGFVPTATRAKPTAPAPLAGVPAPTCTADEANDTIDESFAPVTFDAGDIVESCVQHSADTIRLTARFRRATDPDSDALWRNNANLLWDLDVNNDNNEDFVAFVVDEGARLAATDSENPTDSCAGTAGFDGANVIATFPRACLGNPQFLSARPLSLFPRLPRLEPEPPVALDLYRFPGFGALVGAPGVTVPVQARPTPGATTPPATVPDTGGGVVVIPGSVTGGSGSGVITTGGTTSGATTSGGTTTGAATPSTSSSSRTGTVSSVGQLAFTGLVSGRGPVVGGAGSMLAGLALVLAARRPVRPKPGPWDLLGGAPEPEARG
jgi:hypothetical protein